MLIVHLLIACAHPTDTGLDCAAHVAGAGGYTLWTSAGTILGAPLWDTPADPCGRLPPILGDVTFTPTDSDRATVLVDNLGEGACGAQVAVDAYTFTCVGTVEPWQLAAVFDARGIRVAVSLPPE